MVKVVGVMPREKKDGRYINYYIDRKIYDKLNAYAKDKGQTVTMALERILEKFFAEEEERYNNGKKRSN